MIIGCELQHSKARPLDEGDRVDGRNAPLPNEGWEPVRLQLPGRDPLHHRALMHGQMRGQSLHRDVRVRMAIEIRDASPPTNQRAAAVGATAAFGRRKPVWVVVRRRPTIIGRARAATSRVPALA